jgi:MFS family permease
VRLAEALLPLAEREFRLLFAGRLVSFLGSALAPIALAFAVIDDLDGTATQLGLVLAAIWVPQIVFLLVGGVVADRLPRNLVLVGANVLSGLAQLTAGALLVTGTAEIWQLVVTQVVRGIATSFFFPASTGIVPQTVSAERLQQANALLRMTTNSSFIVGAAAGGLVVATAGAGVALIFDALTYLASAAVLLFMHVEGNVRTDTSFLRELRGGWIEFRSREWLWVIVLAATFGNMISQGCWAVLGPIVADRSLGGAAAWGTILAVQSVGLIVGGLVALQLRPRHPLVVGQLAVMLPALAIAALALDVSVALVAAGAFLFGLGVELFGVYWDTALQQHVPHQALSRVSSYDMLGSIVAVPIGLSIVGPVADALGVAATLWLGAGLFLVTQAAALLSRDVRTLTSTTRPVAAMAAP